MSPVADSSQVNIMHIHSSYSIIINFIAITLCLSFSLRDARAQDVSTPIEVPSSVDDFNILFDQAKERLKGLIQLGGFHSNPPTTAEEGKLIQSIRELEACVSAVPNHWQSMLFLAKAHQKLGNHEIALLWLTHAMEIELSSSVLPKEASIEAVALCDLEQAIAFSEEAIRRKPGSPELLGNHAMNLLLAEQDRTARETIEKALKVAPEDRFNIRISKLIQDVISGRKKRPTCKTVFN